MLNWLVSYLNYNGYNFNDSSYGYNNNHYNYARYEYDYRMDNYQQQSHAAPSRRQRNRASRRNKAANANQNRQNQLEAEKRKALEAANLKKGLETKIEEGNKGYELLVKMGYEEGKGLGRNAEGIKEPIMIEKKADRKGLGAVNTKKTAAIQDVGKCQSKTKNRKENEETEKTTRQVKVVQQQTEVARKVAITKPQQALKPKPITEVTKIAEIPIPQMPQKIIQSTDSPKISPTTAQKVVATLPTQTVTPLSAPKADKLKFSTKDPCTPEFLYSLARAFNSEIELMQLRLAAAASLNHVHDDNDLIVVKIYIDNNPNVADHVFEFVRTELVGWIGAYQQDGLDTPIFHSITNNGSHITIVCDNIYAFQCLERCIEDIVQMKTMDSLKILRLPPITPMIYCFDAKYEGIASDADLFLLQLHLHKPKLYTDNWVVASQELCVEERKTFFIFLIDERSALALNFHYNRSFFICMQQVTFRNRGIVRETISN